MINTKILQNYIKKWNDYNYFIFSRLTDTCYLTTRKTQFLHQANQSLNLTPLKANKFSNRVTAHFGSYEMEIFDRLLNSLQGFSWGDKIAHKCTKDVQFLYGLNQLIAQYPQLQPSAIMYLSYLYKGDFKAVASILNGIKDPHRINNLTNEVVNLHKNLLRSCHSTRWEEEKFHNFLRFLSTSDPWKFLEFDPVVQFKIQTAFLKLQSQSQHNSLSQLINNKNFIKLDLLVQLELLHKVSNDTTQFSTLSDVISDDQFHKLGKDSQKGVFNLIKFISWNLIKVKFTTHELKQISKVLANDTIEIKENRIEFQAMLKTKNFGDLEALVKKDRLEFFQKKALSNLLALLTELKQHHLTKVPTSIKQKSDPYTLTESQMKLYLKDKFKEKAAFTDDSSWLKHNLNIFINDIYSKTSISLIEFALNSSTILNLCSPIITSGYVRLTSVIVLFISILAYQKGYIYYYLFSIPSLSKYESLKKELLNILQKEDQFAFYHGAEGNRGALFEMYTQMRALLIMTANAGDNEITNLRDFDDHFENELTTDKFKKDVENRWKTHSKWEWYDHPSYYASRCISSNIGLFGNLEGKGECTMAYWQYGTSCNHVNNNKVLSSLISRVWGNGFKKTDLDSRVKAYNTLINKIANLTGGTLLQILVDKDHVDDIAFVSEAGGIPLNIQLTGEHSMTDKPSKLLGLQKQDPNAYEETLKNNSGNFKKKVHLSQNFRKHFATQQARVIPHPKTFTDPNKVKIYKYDAAIPETDSSAKAIQKRKELAQLRKQLKDMLREDVLRSAANGVQLDAGSIATHKGVLPVQRYFQYVMKGVFDEQVIFKTDAQKTIEEQNKNILQVIKTAKNAENLASPSDLKIGKQVMKNDLEPKALIDLLKGSPELRTLFEKRHYIVGNKQEVHTESLLKTFETQKNTLDLGNGQVHISRLMRVIIAFEGLAPKDQLTPLVIRHMVKMGFRKNEILLATNLLSCDIFEKYIFINNDTLQQSRAKTEEVLKIHAAECGIPFETYFMLQYFLQVAKSKSGPASKFYKPEAAFNGLELPEAQPDLKEWIEQLLNN